MTFPQISFPASWGPLFNLSSGKIVVDDRTFSLVPNTAMTALTLSVGKAYSNQVFPIDAIIGYESNFMAWMSIILNDGKKIKLSIGSKSKKREMINALEQRRLAIFSDMGKVAPQQPIISIFQHFTPQV